MQQAKTRNTPEDRGHQVLEDAITQAVSTGNSRLPTTIALASRARISPAVMSRCIRTVTGSGRIVARRKTGIFLAEADTFARTDRPRLLRTVTDVGEHINRSIAKGIFSRGHALPPVKVLASDIGVSRPTVLSAITRLVAEGNLIRQGRRFLVPLPNGIRGSTGRIILILTGDSDGNPAIIDPRTATHIQAMERACINHGFSMVLTTNTLILDRLNHGSPTAKVALDSLQSSDVSAYMVWPIGFFSLQSLGIILEWCSIPGCPVLVFDEEENASMRKQVAPPGCRFFALETGESAGYRMGCHLRALGHRTVAFVHPGQMSKPAGLRLDGIRRALIESWGASALVINITNNREPDYDFYGTVGAENVPLFREHATAALSRLIHATAQEGVVIFAEQLSSIVERLDYAREVTPLIRQALAIPAITAIIGSTDRCAQEILVRIQKSAQCLESLMVAGFDNGIDASSRQFTSYDFGGVEAISAMVDFVARPFHSPYARTPASKVISIPGKVIPRNTVTVV